ncbi:S1 family peptidase [Streptomyces sp. NPDC055080]
MEGNNVIPLGSCFLINKPGHFVTAAHVINGSDANLVLVIQNNRVGDYQDTANNSIQVLSLKLKEIDPLRDTCVLITDIPNKSNISLSNTDVLTPGEKVTIFGYPHANQGRSVLTQQTTEVGAKILLSSGIIKSKHIVLNIQARPGQSGGPIFRNSDLSLVGILIGAYAPKQEGGISLGGIDPQTLHQTTHAVSAEYLEGMLKNE